MMSSVKIRLNVMSPMHVGCGEVYEPTSFRVDAAAGKLLAFDPLALIDSLDGAGRNSLEKVCGGANLLAIIKEVGRLASGANVPPLSSVDMAKGLLEHYYTVMKMSTYKKDEVINQFTLERTAYNPNGGFPYIPGSSLKGAIRTAYLNALNKGSKDFRRESDLLGGSFQDDPFRLLKVPDLLPIEPPTTRLLYAVNVRKKGGAAKGPFQILETIAHGSLFEGVLSLNQPPKGAKVKALPPIKQLLNCLNSSCLARYREDNTVMGEIGASSFSKELASRIGKFSSNFQEQTAVLLRLGRHGGAESHTLDGARKIKIKQQNNTSLDLDHATTIWLAAEDKKADNGMPFGWAVLEILPLDVRAGIYPKRSTIPSITPEDKPQEAPAPVAARPAPREPERIIWEDATLTWSPGNQTVRAVKDGKKAEVMIGSNKAFVPEMYHEALFDKRKDVKAKITVEPLGGKNYKIVGIG